MIIKDKNESFMTVNVFTVGDIPLMTYTTLQSLMVHGHLFINFDVYLYLLKIFISIINLYLFINFDVSH